LVWLWRIGHRGIRWWVLQMLRMVWEGWCKQGKVMRWEREQRCLKMRSVSPRKKVEFLAWKWILSLLTSLNNLISFYLCDLFQFYRNNTVFVRGFESCFVVMDEKGHFLLTTPPIHYNDHVFNTNKIIS